MDDDRTQLLDRITARRAGILAYLRQTRPRRGRLTDLAVVSTAVTAVLTAGPALGGVPFAEAARDGLGLTSSAVVWQALCLGALVMSLVATVATNLSRSQELASRVAAAEACNVALDGLETSLRFGQMPVQDAVDLYQQYVARIPFVDDVPAR
ncbi:MAG TPA: hypothetical protein VGP02_02375 [Mycobacteriales bacterium]|nr:hypothetical protein [Mycobacteriales bacterium]